jgi:hypothetical protein
MKAKGVTTLRTVAAVAMVLTALVVGCTGTVWAAGPTITIGHAFSGSLTTETIPTFTGGTNDILDPVTLKVYAGASASGSPVQTSTSMPVPTKLLPLPSEGTWSITPGSPLKSGQYTALAEQTNVITHTGRSPAVTFTVDATPPTVSIAAPAANAIVTVSRPTFSGSAGQAKGDRQSVALSIYAGDAVAGSPVAGPIALSPTGGAWTTGAVGPQLANGIYTAEVTQSDELGGVGSATATFAVSVAAVAGSQAAAPPLGAPAPASAAVAAATTAPAAQSSSAAPGASFQWLPVRPHTGEPVVLASTSTDADSAITGFAWDLTGAGAFATASSVLSTSFAKPGAHVVRLRVTDAHGLSSVASRTIEVIAAPPTLMQPFPVVRIADTVSALRVNVSLLTVQAPVGSTVTVTCTGPGCPVSSQDRVATSARTRNRMGGLVLIAFRRFDRALRFGASLHIKVSASGQIGKYTSFTVRRGKLPVRVDECLSPTRGTPIVCPLR